MPGLDPCGNPSGLDLDVTLGPPIGVGDWYRADVSLGAPADTWLLDAFGLIGTGTTMPPTADSVPGPPGLDVDWTAVDLVTTP